MGLFRRRLDPERAAAIAAFMPVAEPVERAQRALLAAVPTFRDDGVPLAIALANFTVELKEAEDAMVGWKQQAPLDLWERCAEGLVAARKEADDLRLEPGELVFEALNGRLGDILFHLEAFADAERSLRDGGKSSRGR
ncbi:MAG: hypothetical protein ACLGH3_07760 [Actinomycetota bacterium]